MRPEDGDSQARRDPPDLGRGEGYMSPDPPPDRGGRPRMRVHRLDEACDRFEAAWRDGQAPRIEDYLAFVDERERPSLLREMLALEVELRQRRGERPTPQEYS